MNTKTSIAIISFLLLCALGLATTLSGCNGGAIHATPTTESRPTATGTAEATKAIPSPSTAVPTTPGVNATETPTVTPKPGEPTYTSGPTPTPSEGEKAAAAVGKEYITYQATAEECGQLVESGQAEACVYSDSIELITRSEWEQLLPNTRFYLIGLAGRHQIASYDHSYRRELVAWQDNQYYTAKTYDRLLEANGIVITDENRELVAESFVLMTLPDYIESEITFSDEKEIDEPGGFSAERFNYTVTAWTKLQGLQIQWLFMFRDGQVKSAAGGILSIGTGDYIQVPSETLSPVLSNNYYSFWGH